jgi:hypothetical protein
MRTGTLAKMVAAYGLGAALWAVPLLALSGGPAAYLRTLASQGAEDFSGVAMLWTTRSVRALADALYFTFISPWGSEPLAVVMLFLAVLGALVAVWRGRAQMLALLALAFLPYLAFHLLFQETATTRYALPVVLPVALLIVQAGGLLPARAGQVAAGVLVAASLAVSVPQAFWYSRTEAPAFRMLEDMRRLSEGRDVLPVLAMHRRAEFDLRRPIRWIAGRTPAVERRLPSPPKHEWLEMVNYWNLGGRAPVWFVADPLRSDLALVDRRRIVRRYRWPSDLSAVLGGVRPNEMDWHVIDRPGWFAGAGWDLTPETAGVTREDGRGPGKSPIHAWIRRNPGGETTLMVGGRNHGGPAGRIQVTLDGRQIDSASIAPGFFLRMQALPSGALDGPGDYAMLTIAADTDLIAIEQFDAAPASEIVFGFGEGWHELEYSPRTGRMWRWSSDRAVVRVRARGRSLMLKLAGEVEAAGASNVVLRAGDRTLVNQRVGRRFEIAASVPADAMAADEVALTLETSESYVPAEVGESGDRRRLGLKIYDFDLTPAF